jgi:hypothetical protein
MQPTYPAARGRADAHIFSETIMSRHQRYLERELTVIREEWVKGTSVREIAVLLDRDPIALASRIARMALPPRNGRSRNVGAARRGFAMDGACDGAASR